VDGLPEVVPPQDRYAVPEEGIETLLKSRVQTLHRATQQEKRRIIADLSKVLKVKAKTGLDSSVLRAAMGATRTLESTGDTELGANSGQKGNRFSGADGSHLSTRRGVRFFPSFFPGTRSVPAVIRRLAPMPPEKW
jgi:hypothetical protein